MTVPTHNCLMIYLPRGGKPKLIHLQYQMILLDIRLSRSVSYDGKIKFVGTEIQLGESQYGNHSGPFLFQASKDAQEPGPLIKDLKDKRASQKTKLVNGFENVLIKYG